jgi:hypothetical protein
MLMPRTVKLSPPGTGVVLKIILDTRFATSVTEVMPASAIVAAVSTVIDSGTFCTFSVILRAVTSTDSNCEDGMEVSSACEMTGSVVATIAAAHKGTTFRYCDILALLHIFDGLPWISAPRHEVALKYLATNMLLIATVRVSGLWSGPSAIPTADRYIPIPYFEYK